MKLHYCLAILLISSFFASLIQNNFGSLVALGHVLVFLGVGQNLTVGGMGALGHFFEVLGTGQNSCFFTEKNYKKVIFLHPVTKTQLNLPTSELQ